MSRKSRYGVRFPGGALVVFTDRRIALDTYRLADGARWEPEYADWNDYFLTTMMLHDIAWRMLADRLVASFRERARSPLHGKQFIFPIQRKPDEGHSRSQ